MSSILEKFNKQKEFLICIDSDGCAIDTMDIKHIKCFGSCMITEWNPEEWRESILDSWSEVNLYTLTRGIDRFRGLAVALTEINDKCIEIERLDEFLKWTDETLGLPNKSLEEELKKTNSIRIRKTLEWSRAVNRPIDLLNEEEKSPFESVREAVIEAKKIADIAIISFANEKAVLDEWSSNGLLESVDIVLTQNIGPKAYYMSKFIEKRYNRRNVSVMGSALEDLKAAESDGVLYYPIMVKKEKESWNRFTIEVLKKFVDNSYIGRYQEKVINEFKLNLSK